MGVILRSAIVYVVLLLILRMTSRRIMRTATPMDMVLIFVFGGIGVTAVLQDERSVTACFLALATFGLLHVAAYPLKLRLPVVGLISDGAPMVVFENGRWREDRLRHAHLEHRDVLAEARQRGLKSMDEVALAVVEHTGGITFVSHEDAADSDAP